MRNFSDCATITLPDEYLSQGNNIILYLKFDSQSSERVRIRAPRLKGFTKGQ